MVNVAGGLTTYGPIETLTVKDLDREVAINLKTTVLVSQAAIPALTAPLVIRPPSSAHWILIGSLMEDLRRIRGELVDEE